MNKKLFLLLPLLATFAIAANAQTRTKKATVKPKPKTAVLAAGAVKTPSGLIYLITKKGAGRVPKVGETVVVHYTGTLTNGAKFDSSHDPGRQPYAFPLGKGQVVKGWDEGIAKLNVGGQAVLVIPSTLGYGPKGRGPIPPNATMIFVVELVEIQEQ